MSERLGDSSLRIVQRQEKDRKGFGKIGKLPVTLCMALLLVSGFAHAGDNALISEANAALAKKDYSTAVSKFSVVAQQGNAAAQFNMGVFYINGQGVPRDEKLAYEWFGKSAAQGNARALQVLQNAAAKGNENAKSELSRMQQQKPSQQTQAPAQSPQASSAAAEEQALWEEANAALTQKDYVTAFPKFHTLAQQGNAMAQYNLGALYLSGLGIQKDEKLAYEWFAKSAAQGNARAISVMQTAAKAKEEAQAKAAAEEQVKAKAKAKAQAAAEARAEEQAKAKADAKAASSARPGKSAQSDLSLGVSGGVSGKMEGIKNSPSFGLLAGYRINSSFSVEVAYNLLYRNANADSFISATYPGTTATFDLTAISAAGQYRYGLGSNLSLLGNLGFHSSSFKVKSSGSGSTTGSSSGLVLGGKVQYDLNRSIGIRGGFDTYFESGGMTGRITEVGVAVVTRF